MMGRVGGNGKIKRQGGWEGPREKILSIFGPYFWACCFNL